MPEPVCEQVAWSQVFLGAQAGLMRQILAKRDGRPEVHGAVPQSWEANVVGAIGEVALAQHLGLYWHPVQALDRGRDRPDVGPFEVRTTTANPGHLLLYPSDPDDRLFYFVRFGEATREGQTLEVVGSVLAGEGKAKGEWRPGFRGCPCFWIPAEVFA